MLLVTELAFNPFDPEFNRDPYPFYRYRRLQAEAPVFRHPMGFHVLTRYEDVVTLLRDPRGYPSRCSSRTLPTTPGCAAW
jgi:cytochrome P450